MTTIAYYDGVMAGDRKAVTSNAHVFSVAKVGKIGGWLYGFSGDLMPDAVVKTMALERITEGKPLEGVWGSSGWKDGGYVGGYLVSPDKEIYRVESDKEGVVACARVYAEFVACGSGRDFALAAMSLGKQPERAVFVASQFDVNTGIECDVVKLDSEIWEPSPPDAGLPAQEDSGLPAHQPANTSGQESIQQEDKAETREEIQGEVGREFPNEELAIPEGFVAYELGDLVPGLQTGEEIVRFITKTHDPVIGWTDECRAGSVPWREVRAYRIIADSPADEGKAEGEDDLLARAEEPVS